MARTAHALHILVKHKDKADDIMAQLKKGKKFAELARKYSTCPSGKKGAIWASLKKVRWYLSLTKWFSPLKQLHRIW